MAAGFGRGFKNYGGQKVVEKCTEKNGGALCGSAAHILGCSAEEVSNTLCCCNLLEFTFCNIFIITFIFSL